MIRHNGHILSSWLDAGMSLAKAKQLAAATQAELAAAGWAPGWEAHPNRRSLDGDYVAATSPSGWRANHAGAATLKIRGCDHYRAAALEIARRLSEEASA
jgi:hypothetical protein